MSDSPQTLVVDASVVVKWFFTEGESGVEDAAVLLADHAAGRCMLVAPTLLVHELLGVFVRRLPPETRGEALDAFFDAGVELVPPSRTLMSEAATLVAERQISAFDSAYVALASSCGFSLVTADRRLATAVGRTVRTQLV
jgi:predicted nucleic acid-binding protein